MNRLDFFPRRREVTRDCICDSCKKDDGRLVFCWREKEFALCRECVHALFRISAPSIEPFADRECFESLSKEPYNDEGLNDIEATWCIDLDHRNSGDTTPDKSTLKTPSRCLTVRQENSPSQLDPGKVV